MNDLRVDLLLRTLDLANRAKETNLSMGIVGKIIQVADDLYNSIASDLNRPNVSLNEEEKEFARSNQKINAIRSFHGRHMGLSLRDAKEVVELWQEQNGVA